MIINTSSSTHHHQHHQHLEHLSVILRGTYSTRRSTSREVRGSPATIEYYGRRLLLRGRCSTWSTSASLCGAGAGLGAAPERSAEVRRRLNTMDADCFCVADAALGALQSHFAWLVAGATFGAAPERSAEVRRRLSTMDADCFCVAGAALGAPQSHFAWQVQHSVHLSVIVRGRCSTRSTSREVRGSPATIEYCGLRGRCSTWSRSGDDGILTMDAGCFCVAGAALGALQFHFAWQVQPWVHLSLHWQQLHRGPQKSGDD